VIKKCTLARLSVALLLAWAAACGGDDDGDEDGGPIPDGAPMGDAGAPDAAVVDCSGDHRESAESANNPFSETGAAERTGLSLAAEGAGFWVCGQLDPAQAIEQVVDYDAFEFTIDGNRAVNLRIEMVASQAIGADLDLELYRVPDGPAQEVATGIPVRNGVALIAGLTVPRGRYWVSAAAWRPPELEGPVGYAIRVTENQETCPSAMQMPDYQESGDGMDSIGNDTVQIHLPNAPPVLTEDEKDAPEDTTPLTLEPDAVLYMTGESGAVETDKDSYLDRDTYLVTTGPTTGELELRLKWPDDGTDLDVHLFAAGDPAIDYSNALGTEAGVIRDELMTVNLDPGADYWLWIGAYDDPNDEGPVPAVEYEVTLCPRAYTPPTPPK
jgi:hypothetical protein